MFKPVKINNELYVNSELTSNSDLGMFDDIENVTVIAFDLKETYFNESKKFCLKTFIQSIIKIGVSKSSPTEKQ